MTGLNTEFESTRLDLQEPLDGPEVPTEGVVETDRRPPVADQVDRYVAALSDGNLQQAADAAVEIESSLPPVGDLLTALSDAVEANRVPNVRTLRWQLRERYEQRQVGEAARSERLSLWSGYGPPDPETKSLRTLSTFGRRASAITTRREALFSATIPIRSTTIEQEKRTEIRNRAAQLAQREAALAEAADAAMEVLAGSELPAAVSLLRAQQAGDRVLVGEGGTVEITVGNVGNGVATGVSLSLAGEGITLEPATLDIGELQPMTKVAASVDASVDAGGENRVNVEVTSENAGVDSTSAYVQATETLISIPARYDRNGTGRLSTDDIQQAVADFERGDSVPGTEQLTLTTEDIREMLVMWALDQPV